MSMIRVHCFIYCTLFLACASTPKITFEDYVDTKSKNIRFQEKKVFSFSESGVYFSNNFKGGRLNSVEQLNDSTFTLSIYPENEPINPSPFYAFKIWSEASKNVYLEVFKTKHGKWDVKVRRKVLEKIDSFFES